MTQLAGVVSSNKADQAHLNAQVNAELKRIVTLAAIEAEFVQGFTFHDFRELLVLHTSHTQAQAVQGIVRLDKQRPVHEIALWQGFHEHWNPLHTPQGCARGREGRHGTRMTVEMVLCGISKQVAADKDCQERRRHGFHSSNLLHRQTYARQIYSDIHKSCDVTGMMNDGGAIYDVGTRVSVSWPLEDGTTTHCKAKIVERKVKASHKAKYLLQWDDGDEPSWYAHLSHVLLAHA